MKERKREEEGKWHGKSQACVEKLEAEEHGNSEHARMILELVRVNQTKLW